VATNAWIFGIIIALLALSAIFAYQRWEEWMTAAIGVWVFISPWVLGAVSNARILWSSLVVGALLVSGALVVLARARIRSDRNATLTREPKVRAE
jgi:SPW repeat-containing protein